jgi:hypothetical protein
MKKKIIIGVLIQLISIFYVSAQKRSKYEKYGNTFNMGIGAGGYSGYYKYANRTLAVFNANYEFDIAPSLTLAPNISVYSYQNEYYWANGKNPGQYYTYRETVIPIGIKSAYYFDKLLKAGSRWDFYVGTSIGVSIVNARWESGYQGDKNYYKRANNLYVDMHIGAENHLSKNVGIYLDLSNGVSTFGIAFHSK